MEFSTAEFEFSHGKKPRGFGYWAFFFGRNPNAEAVFAPRGTFAEAKRWAAKEAKAAGHNFVRVGS